MRLDKYLKVSRLIKRRSVANEAADNSKILLNGKTAKPAAQVKVGDVIQITFGSRSISVEVVSVSEYATKDSAGEMYRVLEK